MNEITRIGVELGTGGSRPCACQGTGERCRRAVDPTGTWPYHGGMASVTVKSTYSLDVKTVRQLERLAKSWNTSKSAAIRRAIQTVAHQTLPRENTELDALDRLQHLLALGPEDAAAWEREMQRERRTTA